VLAGFDVVGINARFQIVNRTRFIFRIINVCFAKTHDVVGGGKGKICPKCYIWPELGEQNATSRPS
jgi:hypothetical protein